MSQSKPSDVLIADDDPRSTHTLVSALHTRFHRVRVSRTRKELLDALSNPLISSIVIEPNLPGAGWYGLLERVRSFRPYAKLVVVTAYPSAALRRLSDRLDVHGFLIKPVLARSVLETLLASEPVFDALPQVDRKIVSVEWELINDVIADTGGNMTEAARVLGIPRQTLYRKLRKHPRF